MQNVFFIRSFLCEKLQLLNWGGTLRAITPPSKKTLPFLKEHRNEIIPFALLHLKFCSAIEKCYYLAILLKMSIGAAKIIYCELFKDKGYSRLLLWCKLWQFCFMVFIFEFSLTFDSRPLLVSLTPSIYENEVSELEPGGNISNAD